MGANALSLSRGFGPSWALIVPTSGVLDLAPAVGHDRRSRGENLGWIKGPLSAQGVGAKNDRKKVGGMEAGEPFPFPMA